MIKASNFRNRETNTLKGFVDLKLEPPGLMLHECGVHERDGKRWIQLPSRPMMNKDGKAIISPKAGKISYAACVSIEDPSARAEFREAALKAVDQLMGRAS